MPKKKPRHRIGGWPDLHNWNAKKLVALTKRYKPHISPAGAANLGWSEAQRLRMALQEAMRGYRDNVRIYDQAPTPKEVRKQVRAVISKTEALQACLNGLHDATSFAIQHECPGFMPTPELMRAFNLNGPLDRLKACAKAAENKLDGQIAQRGNRGGGRPRERALDLHLKKIADAWKKHMPEWFANGQFKRGKKKDFLTAISDTLLAAKINPPNLRNLEDRLTRAKWFKNSP